MCTPDLTRLPRLGTIIIPCALQIIPTYFQDGPLVRSHYISRFEKNDMVGYFLIIA